MNTACMKLLHLYPLLCLQITITSELELFNAELHENNPGIGRVLAYSA